MSDFLISYTLVLTLLSLILFWLKMMLFSIVSFERCDKIWSIALSVNKFCERFRVIILVKFGNIFYKA